VDALGREHVIPHGIDQRHQRRRRCTDPIGERRDVELNALARVDLALTVERQMQPVLREQDVRQQRRPGAPTRDRMRGRRRLRDRLAGSARVLLAHVLDHLPLARDQLQCLGYVLAELVQGTAAAQARCRRRIDHALARQMLRERSARRLEPLERLHLDVCARRRVGRDLRPGFRLRCILFHVGKPQFELLEHGATFRGLAEPLMPELGDRELHLFDHQFPGTHFRLGVARHCLGFQTRRLRGNHHRLQGRDVIGKRIRSGCHELIAARIADLGIRNPQHESQGRN
jgi:hypothetical protein